MNSKESLRLAPVKNYTPPNLPTLEEAGSNLQMKTLPARWKKNAAVMACLGFTGVLALSGCRGGIFDNRTHHGGAGGAPIYISRQTEQETLAQIQAQIEAADLDMRIHFGGSGSGPFYVAHITEQEVLGFIRARLEAAGLNFDSVPPEYTIWGPGDMTPRPGIIDEKKIDLFDAVNRVAVISMSWEESNRPFSIWGNALANTVRGEFSERKNDISFGVFYNPGRFMGEGAVDWIDDEMVIEMEEVTAEEKDTARLILIEQLTTQVDNFIARLQAEGIIRGA